MGRGPARPIKFREDGPRTGPAHQNLNSLGPARPSPSHFQKSPPGPARHNFQIGPARPGPDKRPITIPDVVRILQVNLWYLYTPYIFVRICCVLVNSAWYPVVPAWCMLLIPVTPVVVRAHTTAKHTISGGGNRRITVTLEQPVSAKRKNSLALAVYE